MFLNYTLNAVIAGVAVALASHDIAGALRRPHRTEPGGARPDSGTPPRIPDPDRSGLTQDKDPAA